MVAAAWDAAAVRTWLERRVAAARADQVTAERHGRDRHDDCDQAAAEEIVCAALLRGGASDSQDTLAAALKALQEKDEFIWRGVYDDRKFDRHARGQIRKLMKMVKTNAGFERLGHYQ
jgi:uncharacterized protein YfkK (UPF0435 family)